MANNPIQEMIAAFAVGCMDKENFIQFKDYLKEEGELPKGELGELQNIVSMIPIILELETPDPSLKDNVAKRLINMKDEIKTKIREDRKKTFATTVTKSSTFVISKTKANKITAPHAEPELQGEHKFPDTFHSTAKIELPNEFTKSVAHELRSSKIESEQPQSLFAPGVSSRSTGTPSQTNEKFSNGLIGWVSLMLSIILFCIVGYFTYNSVSSLNKKVDELESKITSLRGELASSTNFVNNYISVIEFFNYKDVTVVNLNSTAAGDKATARVFLAYEEKEGLVQFKNVKPLQPNQGYQLWLISKGQAYSMGVYVPNGSEYLRITSFPFIPKELIQEIRVTIESNTGSPTPSVQNYLSGSMK
jgi:hypothetical protein